MYNSYLCKPKMFEIENVTFWPMAKTLSISLELIYPRKGLLLFRRGGGHGGIKDLPLVLTDMLVWRLIKAICYGRFSNIEHNTTMYYFTKLSGPTPPTLILYNGFFSELISSSATTAQFPNLFIIINLKYTWVVKFFWKLPLYLVTHSTNFISLSVLLQLGLLVICYSRLG